MGINWNWSCSTSTWGKMTLHWEWQSPGTASPETLGSLLLWRHSKLTWMCSCETYSRWPCLDKGIGLMISKIPFQTKQYCDSMILWFLNNHSLPQVRGRRFLSQFSVQRVEYIPGEFYETEILHIESELGYNNHLLHRCHACCLFFIIKED